MHPDFLDRHARMDTPVHRLPAWAKLLAALALVGGTIAIPRAWPILLCIPAAILIVVAIVSRLPKRFLVLRMLFLEPFVLGVAVMAIFQPGGWWLFGILVARGTICLLAMVLLANTTPFSEILRVLRRVKVPGLLITTLSLMYRYIFVLIDETERLKRARASRTFVRTRRGAWRMMAGIAGQLFVRASERAERIYAAMCARGWR